MEISTCIKYYEFLNSQCKQLIDQKRITREQYWMFGRELEQFKQKVAESNLPNDVKLKTQGLNLLLAPKQDSEEAALFRMLTVGLIRSISELRKQDQIKSSLQDFRSQIADIPSHIRLHHETE